MKAALEYLFIYMAGTCLVALLGVVLIWLGFELGFAFIVLAVWGGRS